MTALQEVPPDLEAPVLHVWLLFLTRMRFAQFAELLSDDERMKRDRFVFDHDRHRYESCRGALRILLGHYLARDPKSLAFSYGTHGKPQLLIGAEPSDVCFNVSHSRDTAIVVLGRGTEVGADIEYMRDDIAFDEVSHSFLAPDEWTKLVGLSPELKSDSFFCRWTLKEAVLKAMGHGLSVDPRSFGVEPAPAGQWQRVTLRGLERKHYQVQGLSLGLDCRGAVAYLDDGLDRSCTMIDFNSQLTRLI